MFDWWLTLILGRDIVNPRVDDRGAVYHALYEPGQIIVAAGEMRRYHYIVESGEADLVSTRTGAEVVLGSLEQGNYFGHATRPDADCSVRARTRVRLLAIADEAAEALSAVRPDLAAVLKGNESGCVNTPV
jgi:CRP-like cAMP-binding protein